LRSLAAISYGDVMFAAALWAAGRAALAVAPSRPLSILFSTLAGGAVLYAVGSVIFFGIFGGFLTYPLLGLVGDVRMLSSSVSAHLTTIVVLTLLLVPLVYAAVVETSIRIVGRRGGRRRLGQGVAILAFGGWLAVGSHTFSAMWATRDDWRIAENPHWVLLSSWWEIATGRAAVRMEERFPADYLEDFEPIGPGPQEAAAPVRPATNRPGQAARVAQPPNVVVVVLESVAARWTNLHGGLYDSTPVLAREASRALVADHFYAHVGRSSNSLAAMLLSAYPKLGFRDATEEYPELRGTSLASLFQARGYRTSFVTPSDLSWASWDDFLDGRGFDEVRDQQHLACSEPISSWGVEDRCMVDGLIEFIERDPTHPFFAFGWTTQTHHPYEPTPGAPLVEMRREPVPDQYDLDRYLSVLRETDRHLGRLFDAVRHLGLEQHTLVAVLGDHGQAFGFPHDTYIQGRTAYEEDVHVPAMFWFPAKYRSQMRSDAVASHVDLAPTIAELAGLAAAADWQGRSLFDGDRPDRAYFYVAQDEFTLGLRDRNWKYIFNLRRGVEELYDLARDPHEQRNVAGREPGLSVRMRQRLAAWTEANRRQYELVEQR
jgi:arylsulfatase A-like enzyme